MRVRPMTRDDAAAVAELAGQLGYPSTNAQIERRFLALRDRGDSALFVAEDEAGAVAGWAHVMAQALMESEPFAQLMGLVVAEGTRRQGAGRCLVQAAEAWAKQRGLTMMRVNSNSARTLARPFYERMGYTIKKTQWAFTREL